MKKLYLLLFFTLFIFTSKAQVITFSDAAFKSKLLESSPDNFISRNLNGDYFAIDANANNEIEETEALEVAFLEIDGAAISSLNDITYFTNLVSLNCENNSLTGLNVSNLLYLLFLNCSNNQLVNLNVNGLTELQNINCQFNQLINLDVSGITNLLNLNCSYNQIATLNLNNLLNLEVLNCNNNQIATFDLTDLINVKTLDCSYNQLLTINPNSLTSLESLNCNSNLLISLSISNLINFDNLDCSNNQLTTLILSNLSNINDLNCNFNQLTSINLTDVFNLENFSCTNNLLSNLNPNGLTQLQILNFANNQITSIDLTGLSQIITLNCSNNQLTNIDLSNLTNLKYLYCNANSIPSINVSGLNMLLVLSCTNNQITNLNINNANNIQSLYCTNNQIATLNLSSLTNLQNLFCSNNQLTSLFIKNGSFESNLQFSGNSSIEYICSDESEIESVQNEINTNNYSNCYVNSYCSFAPGGVTYTIQGNVKYDGNSNGCDAIDNQYPNLQLSFSDGLVSESFIPNGSGNYSKLVRNGSYTITPILENPNYFSVNPLNITVDFPLNVSPFNQNFCIAANGNHSDIEITIFPLNSAIPGLDATYKIVYKNKGTISQSGLINLNFSDAILDLLLSIPAVSSQNNNNLNWVFSNLLPLETRTILVTLNLNSGSETPPVNVGQLITYSASVNTSNTDETPNNNISNLNQIVENSAGTNNKICIEGSSISLSQVGEYVHYSIRFKNNGTSVAQNIVVKDIIDTSKYDIATLVPLNASHTFRTRIANLNVVEFIFENINLPFSNTNNDGYVIFKIKTVPTLVIGDTFLNTATVYFDYKAPLTTNTESTIVQSLNNIAFGTSDNFSIYPNPAKEILNINSKNLFPINSISIYNTIGQLIQIVTNPKNKSIDVSQLKSGIYILNIYSDNRVESIKFIKE